MEDRKVIICHCEPPRFGGVAISTHGRKVVSQETQWNIGCAYGENLLHRTTYIDDLKARGVDSIDCHR